MTLGGLGARQGAEIAYQWVPPKPPSVVVRLLPWLALLSLSLLKCNRSPQVLWIGLALVLGLALGWVIATLPMAPFTGDAPFSHALKAVAFGLATVWLLSPCFDREMRFLTLMGTLLTMELSGLFALAAQQPWNEDAEWGRMLLTAALFGLVLSLAVHLAGWSCRGRFGRCRLLLRLLLWMIGCWAVAFLVLSLLLGAGGLGEMTVALVAAAAITFSLLLPFLILSFVNGYFGERLKVMLQLGELPKPRLHTDTS